MCVDVRVMFLSVCSDDRTISFCLPERGCTSTSSKRSISGFAQSHARRQADRQRAGRLLVVARRAARIDRCRSNCDRDSRGARRWCVLLASVQASKPHSQVLMRHTTVPEKEFWTIDKCFEAKGFGAFSAIVVDEAHLFCSWATFRPACGRSLVWLRGCLAPKLLLSATVTPMLPWKTVVRVCFFLGLTRLRACRNSI